MMRGSTLVLTTAFFLGAMADSQALAQAPPARTEQLPAPKKVKAPPQQPNAVTVIDPATGRAVTTSTGLGHGASIGLMVPPGAFDPRAGTWQMPSPPPGAFPLAVRFPTTGVWYYPYPHPPSGQGIVDNRWGVRLR